MRSRERIPSEPEQIALQAYLDADIACQRHLAKDLFPNDQRAQSMSQRMGSEAVKDRIDQLLHGKITYAEYFRRVDIDSAKLDASLGFNQGFLTEIEAWLNPQRSSYPDRSPWWVFYRFAIATAADVDRGKISKEVGRKLIEDKRLEFNAMVGPSTTAEPVTVNCAFSTSNGRRLEEPFQIDAARSTVNGSRAEFYENEIHWRNQRGGGTTFTLRLNRLSGFATFGDDKFPSLLSGYCTQATRQF